MYRVYSPRLPENGETVKSDISSFFFIVQKFHLPAIFALETIIFVGSVDAEGFPNIKAMLQTRKREGLKHIYLSTNTSSMRVSQFLKNNRACLYVCNTRFFKGVMLRGTMEILTDSTSKEMIWQEGDTMYYPEGVTDPDYCVLKFTAFSGRYYSGFKSEDFTIE